MARKRSVEGSRGNGGDELGVREVGNGGDCRDERGVLQDKLDVNTGNAARVQGGEKGTTAY